MTEAEWRATRHTVPMLVPFLRNRLSARKLRLFHIACCRLHLSMFHPAGAAGLLDLAERCADGRADRRDLLAQVEHLVWATDPNDLPPDYSTLVWPYSMLSWEDPYAAAVVGSMEASMTTAADLLRCIVGNPFPRPRPAPPRRRLGQAVLSALVKLAGGSPHQPAPEETANPAVVPLPEVDFDPAWRTEAVVGLARGIYDDKAFDRLPVLADALEDSGCADADILADLPQEKWSRS